jgi:hypothetical protein
LHRAWGSTRPCHSRSGGGGGGSVSAFNDILACEGNKSFFFLYSICLRAATRSACTSRKGEYKIDRSALLVVVW